jgi:hypothetical protein
MDERQKRPLSFLKQMQPPWQVFIAYIDFGRDLLIGIFRLISKHKKGRIKRPISF